MNTTTSTNFGESARQNQTRTLRLEPLMYDRSARKAVRLLTLKADSAGYVHGRDVGDKPADESEPKSLRAIKVADLAPLHEGSKIRAEAYKAEGVADSQAVQLASRFVEMPVWNKVAKVAASTLRTDQKDVSGTINLEVESDKSLDGVTLALRIGDVKSATKGQFRSGGTPNLGALDRTWTANFGVRILLAGDDILDDEFSLAELIELARQARTLGKELRTLRRKLPGTVDESVSTIQALDVVLAENEDLKRRLEEPEGLGREIEVAGTVEPIPDLPIEEDKE